MGFTTDFRAKFASKVQERYKAYWHAMHPRDYTPRDLYKLGFTDEEWAALVLLRDRRKEVLRSGWNWTYTVDFNQMLDRPEYIPKEPDLTFKVKSGWPEISIKEKQLPEPQRTQMRDWIITAYQYENDSNILGSKLRELLRMEFQHTDVDGLGYNRRVERAAVNTPGTLYRVWPELLPFLDSEDRHILRNKKMKSPLPKDWDEEKLAAFHYGPAMERITYALTVMSLIPKEYDKKYPGLD